jgi:AcrR family transcriptional regulator
MGATPAAATVVHETVTEPTLRDEARALFRASVLDAAEAEFAAHGFEAARMQDVARRARVAVGTVYNHFANKDELLRAVLAARGVDALAAFAPREEDGAAFEERFIARFSRLHAFFGAHLAFFEVASRHGVLGGEEPAACPPASFEIGMASAVEQLMREGIAEGALRPDDPARLARFLKGATKHVMLGAAREGKLDFARQGRWVLEMFLRGAADQTPAAPTRRVDPPAAKRGARPAARKPGRGRS